MEEKQSFLKRKNIEFTAKRYFQDALSAMALGLFASLLIGLIIKTLGEQTINLLGDNMVSRFLVDTGTTAMGFMGAAIGIAVAWGLKAPPLVLFTSAITGMMGAQLGGPAGAFIAVAIGAEFGKAVSKETKVDIIVTPAVTLLMGALSAKLIGPLVGELMYGLGKIIMTATEWQPFLFGIVISVIVGLALTAPISSAALCIMLDLSGLAAGAATVGCCAQMVGFAAISVKENGIGGIVAQGIGTSMLQISNIIKNPWILLPPTLAGAIIGPLSTVVFKMTNIPAGAGMGTSGLVGQIGTFTSMGFTLPVLLEVLLLHIALPAVLSILFDRILKELGLIKVGDYKLDL
ncbi:PTS sugar transporter subunit IIC [Anaerovorax odorimutans]|uniref:PTS sugar transporter subunit IIC n=1 Tax=Anaerovorax odorimutans TaxID=109327 RepID=A0ABT1RTI3_9FIRM|nr:PTS sugar transporter subunit IIC [Anaerovorax odorimutans]MCQ4638505.1 PTS sugar transporter subunit IIC [Anaerovorax odorimutans]